jgi:hypothetical protein
MGWTIAFCPWNCAHLVHPEVARIGASTGQAGGLFQVVDRSKGGTLMHGLIYLVGLIVIILAILSEGAMRGAVYRRADGRDHP